MEQKNLVIVESPAKAKTIKKYLGKNFEVLASYGHVRDLVPKEGAVDPKRKFAMRYQILEKNEKHVQAIARALKKSDALYLATDPDREGEAISWHLTELLKELNVLDGKDVHRVVFYEITRNAIREAIEQPREHLAGPGQRAAGAPRARLPRRFQSLAAVVEEGGTARRFGRPRAESGAAHDLRARRRDRTLHGARVLDDRCRRREGAADFSGATDRVSRREGRTVHGHHRAAGRRSARGDRSCRGRQAQRFRDRAQAAQPQSRTAVHDLDAAAGIGAQARLRRAAHDAPRAAAVRRRRLRRRRRRPHHVYAHGLGEPRERGRAGNPPGHRRELRPGVAARVAARLQDQVEECAGSARSGPADLRGDHAGAARRQDRRRSVQALQPDLETRGRQPDGAGGL